MKSTMLDRKKRHLEQAIATCESLLVAFSGGVDSSFLLAVAAKVLRDRVVAVTSVSPVHPPREEKGAKQLAKRLGVAHVIIQTDEMQIPEFLANMPDRCYICKKHLFHRLKDIADDRGLQCIAHGANVDDLGDIRPGFEAAREMGILAPLIDAGLGKEDIRELSRQMGLPTWNKPAMACLASRIPYGRALHIDALRRIDALESVLLELGFGACRVRDHGSIARIEIPEADLERIVSQAEIRQHIVDHAKKAGFDFITLDLEGYRQGSMNVTFGGSKRGDRDRHNGPES